MYDYCYMSLFIKVIEHENLRVVLLTCLTWQFADPTCQPLLSPLYLSSSTSLPLPATPPPASLLAGGGRISTSLPLPATLLPACLFAGGARISSSPPTPAAPVASSGVELGFGRAEACVEGGGGPSSSELRRGRRRGVRQSVHGGGARAGRRRALELRAPAGRRRVRQLGRNGGTRMLRRPWREASRASRGPERQEAALRGERWR